MKLLKSLILSCSLFTASYATATPETVPFVDVERYMGTWYEIASIPKIFQFGCTATTAEYTLKDNGTVEVYNSCKLFGLKGPNYAVRGEARVVDTETNSKLNVNFFRLFNGDYWIFDLADDYSYVLVGSPDFNSLWILSRTRALDDTIVSQLKAKAEGLGFDIGRLKMSKQPHE